MSEATYTLRSVNKRCTAKGSERANGKANEQLGAYRSKIDKDQLKASYFERSSSSNDLHSFAA